MKLQKRTDSELVPIEESKTEQPNMKNPSQSSSQKQSQSNSVQSQSKAKPVFKMSNLAENDNDANELNEEEGSLSSEPYGDDEPLHGIQSGHFNEENDDFAAEHEFKPQDYGKKIKDFLSKGWTKLSEQCPKCFIPLVRDPNADLMFCVSCETQIISKKDFDPKKHRIVGKVGVFEQNLAEEVETDDHQEMLEESEEPEEPGPRPLIPIPEGELGYSADHSFLPPHLHPQRPSLQPQQPLQPQPLQPQPLQPQPLQPQQPLQSQQSLQLHSQYIAQQISRYHQKDHEIKQSLIMSLNYQLSQAQHLLNQTLLPGNQDVVRETVQTISAIYQLLRELKTFQ